MNAGILIAAAIVAAAIIIKIPIGPPPRRYQAGFTDGFYRLDTATGDAWFLAGNDLAAHWLPFDDNGGSR